MILRRVYGSGPLHLLGHLAVFGLTAYAIAAVFVLDDALRVVVWLVGAVLFHDAVLWPLYSGADRAAQRALGPAVNHLRVPLGLSLLLLLVFAGTILGGGEGAYNRASGRTWDGYVTRWLVVSGVLFLVSGAVYVLRSPQRVDAHRDDDA